MSGIDGFNPLRVVSQNAQSAVRKLQQIHNGVQHVADTLVQSGQNLADKFQSVKDGQHALEQAASVAKSHPVNAAEAGTLRAFAAHYFEVYSVAPGKTYNPDAAAKLYHPMGAHVEDMMLDVQVAGSQGKVQFATDDVHHYTHESMPKLYGMTDRMEMKADLQHAQLWKMGNGTFGMVVPFTAKMHMKAGGPVNQLSGFARIVVHDGKITHETLTPTGVQVNVK